MVWMHQVLITVTKSAWSVISISQPSHFPIIGLTVDPYDEMRPRQRFASVPYAMQANKADQVDRASGLNAPDGDPRPSKPRAL